MEKEFIKPDFKNCNVNISATLAEFLGAPNKNATLPILKKELSKGYKNVVFICFDGMGIYPLEKNLDSSNILRKNIKQVLKSTFPSTTTNATTSLMLNKLPLEHGWFGWSMHFASINKNVNIFTNQDSLTGEGLVITDSPLGELNYYFDSATNTNYQINSVFPPFVKVKREDRNNTYAGETEFFETIKNICNRQTNQYIYAYYPDPDATMHDYGVTSAEAKEVIKSISNNVKNLVENTKDTLFVITADHGQVDVEGYVDFSADAKLMDMLKIYPYMEAKAVAFMIKDGMHKQFEEYFKQTYDEDFKLFTSKELIDAGYFGDFGDKGYMLGDFIAIGTYTHKQALTTPTYPKFKGHHTSLTEEMLVPLIIINN